MLIWPSTSELSVCCASILDAILCVDIASIWFTVKFTQLEAMPVEFDGSDLYEERERTPRRGEAAALGAPPTAIDNKLTEQDLKSIEEILANAAGRSSTKVPSVVVQAIQNEMKQVYGKLRKYTNTLERKDKQTESKKLFEEGRVPSGFRKFAMPPPVS